MNDNYLMEYDAYLNSLDRFRAPIRYKSARLRGRHLGLAALNPQVIAVMTILGAVLFSGASQFSNPEKSRATLRVAHLGCGPF